MIRETGDVNTLRPWIESGSWLRRYRKTLIFCAVALTVLAVIAVLAWSMTPDRALLLFDLTIAAIFSAALGIAGRRLLRNDALRHSRMIAVELIGAVVGGTIVGIFAVTVASEPMGLARLPALVVIQLLGGVIGAAITFVPAFFFAGAVKLTSQFVGKPMPALEAASIGAASGSVGGGLVAAGFEYGIWLPLVSASVCAATAYRAVAYHRRLNRM